MINSNENSSNKIEIHISVRNLVEFILRSGDINLTGFADLQPMLEGTRIHRKLQKEAGPLYKAEVRLSYRREYESFVLILEGIADGIFTEGGIETIDEIKTVSTPIEIINEAYNPMHWAQAQLYGYMYGVILNSQSCESSQNLQTLQNLQNVQCPQDNQNSQESSETEDAAGSQISLDQAFAPDTSSAEYSEAMANTEDTERYEQKLRIRLTYYNVDTKKIKYIIREQTFCQLEAYANELLEKYRVWAELQAEYIARRNESIRELAFPFSEYRKGQRNLAASVYKTIRGKNQLFAQAPTGTGKTMSTLFPAVKALAEGFGEKIFYLTAKTVTREVPEKAFLLMADNGLTIRTITITSKERICRCEARNCTPDSCVYAQGHFDRVNEAILDILRNETIITRDILERYSEKHMVCPFEYSLDISLWTDGIICDYNYVFDPRAYLRRYFEFGGDYILLIDEAHNLVERARDMFSAQLNKRAFMELKNEVKGVSASCSKTFNKINKYFIQLKKQLQESNDGAVLELPTELTPLIEAFIEEWNSFMAKNRYYIASNSMLDLFFACVSFIAVNRLYDSNYVTYAEITDNDVLLKLFCVDPSKLIRKACEKCRSAVFFSATLLPLDFFKTMLGGEESDKCIRLPSPFPRENLCLMAVDNISTKYKNRNDTSLLVARYIKDATEGKTGNYMVFFPSFEYMRKVYHIYRETWPYDRTIIQDSSMKDTERESFLEMFVEAPQDTLIAFAVMGGIFSEGIDLTGDRLSGALVIGVGIPQICLERQIISDFFKERRDAGYEYAYMFPGMNRVLQAAGRIIRSETDRGFILLLDERFLQWRYQELFPSEWEGFLRISSPEEAKRELEEFWDV